MKPDELLRKNYQRIRIVHPAHAGEVVKRGVDVIPRNVRQRKRIVKAMRRQRRVHRSTF